MFGRSTLTFQHHKEFELLLACARENVCGSSESVVDLAADVDWGTFLKLAGRHRVIPQASSSLTRRSDQVPDRVLAQLRGARDSLVHANLRLGCELIRVSRRFQAAALPLMAIKGPCLAIQLYGGLEQRQFIDLDFLVRPDDLPQVLELFAELGYRAGSTELRELSAAQLAQAIADSKSTELIGGEASDPLYVDLHWRLANDDAYFPVSAAELIERGQLISVAEQSVLTMAEQDLPLYLAFHGGYHRWMRLSWLCDLARATLRCPESQWLPPSNSSSATNRYLCSGLLLLEQLGFIDHPPAIVERRRGELQRIVAEMREVLSADEAAPLLGVLADGWWRYRFTGRLTPLLNSATRFLRPKQRDLQQQGCLRPYLSRWRYIAARAFGRSAERR